ncbi:MAG: hypothetical protein U0871_21545 [Gemmataceae bacterium]
MRILRLTAAVAAAGLLASATDARAASIPVGATVTFTGGALGNFNVVNTSAPGATITQVQINLRQNGATAPGNLYFDTVLGGPGELLSLAFTPVVGAAATGFGSASGATDGSIALTLTFGGFDAAEVFNFGIDVDHTRPTGIANLLNRSTVTGAEFAGSTVSVTFGGTNVVPTTLTGTFTDQGTVFAQAELSGQAVLSPAPAGAVLAVLGLPALGLLRTRRKATA